MSDPDYTTIRNYYSQFEIPVFSINNKYEIVWKNRSAQDFESRYPDFMQLLSLSLEQMDIFSKSYFSTNFSGGNITAQLICSKFPGTQAFFIQMTIKEHVPDPSLLENELNDSAFIQENQYRNSINNIFNLIPLIYNDLEKHELYDTIEYLKSISSNTYKLLKNTLSYAEFSKLIRLPDPLNNTTIDIVSELEQLFTAVKSSLFRSNIKFSFTLPQHPLLMLVDIEKLNIALLSIISNSCQYSDTQNTVSVDVSEKNDSLIIRVSDFGVGISPEQYEQVFTPFYSYDVDTGSQSGIGLGLSYALTFAEMMGGTLIISGIKNKGTNVILKIPLGDVGSTTKLKSNPFNYYLGKFSIISVYLSDVCEIPLN